MCFLIQHKTKMSFTDRVHYAKALLCLFYNYCLISSILIQVYNCIVVNCLYSFTVAYIYIRLFDVTIFKHDLHVT